MQPFVLLGSFLIYYDSHYIHKQRDNIVSQQCTEIYMVSQYK
jgi:hypothetical protein